MVACVGFVLAARAQGVVPFILALVVVNAGVSAAKPPLWAMPGAFLSGAGAAAGIAMINSIGNLGGFVGPYAIGRLQSATGGYAAGLYAVGATLGVSAMLTAWLGRTDARARLSRGVA
jgi:ACS family tartrate transporter-like MFS transporter